MTPQLLPSDFDQQLARIVRQFWHTRSKKPRRKGPLGKTQGGTRDAVLSGQNMSGFQNLIRSVAMHNGLPDSAVLTGRRATILPGFFRPTKNWDTLVIHGQRLIAAFEFKSQVGSFGNNFNNRSEEAIGSAADLWVAHEHNAFKNPRQPFLGWLMLLEDCPDSTKAVRCDEPNYPVFPEFQGASYAERYRILGERLMERKLYTAAALLLSPLGDGEKTGSARSLSEATSVRRMFLEFAGHVLAAVSS